MLVNITNRIITTVMFCMIISQLKKENNIRHSRKRLSKTSVNSRLYFPSGWRPRGSKNSSFPRFWKVHFPAYDGNSYYKYNNLSFTLLCDEFWWWINAHIVSTNTCPFLIPSVNAMKYNENNTYLNINQSSFR